MESKSYSIPYSGITEQEAVTLNNLELTSIYALLTYVAHIQNVNESTVREIITTRFGISDVTQIRRQSYDDALKFLVDLQMDLLLN